MVSSNVFAQLHGLKTYFDTIHADNFRCFGVKSNQYSTKSKFLSNFSYIVPFFSKFYMHGV